MGIGGSLKGKCLTESIPHWAPGVAMRKGDVQDGLMRRGRAFEAAWSSSGLCGPPGHLVQVLPGCLLARPW